MILLIDALDSFTYNLVQAFQALGEEVEVARFDQITLDDVRKRNPELKIIFVSGYAEEAFAKSLPQGEQFSFLPKPFTLKQLVAAVKETMAS